MLGKSGVSAGYKHVIYKSEATTAVVDLLIYYFNTADAICVFS